MAAHNYKFRPDTLIHLYDALAAGKPPGTLLLMLEGDRPVVSVAVYRKSHTQPGDVTCIFDEIGERLPDTMIFVLWPLDVTRKLAVEAFDFEFPPVDMSERKWR